MFDPVDPKQNFPALERGILKYWQEQDAFKRSVRMRSVQEGDLLNGPAGDSEESFSFYDGPPFATGLPHYGHLLAGTIKDVIPRYQTMKGKRVERRFGWDCHGLPIENIIEKEHGIKDKKQIEDMGVKAFNDLCRGAVQRYTKEWRTVVERMGRWVDMDWDYRTMDPEYMESIWWVFRSLWDKTLIYEGHKPMHICPRCATPLSNFEVTQGYKDITDFSVTAMFRLKGTKGTDGTDEFILAWTTTPWTLPGNLFLAVHPSMNYVRVACEGKTFIVAKDLADKVFKGKEFTVEGKPFKGKSLVGKTYEPLFPYFADKYGATSFRIVGGDFVTAEDGTGIVHIAPGFGEDDFSVGKQEGVPLLQHVGMDGRFIKDVTDFAGQDVKPKDDHTKADKKIAEWLKTKEKLFKTESYKHSYPHCWRCDSPLLNYATSSWFVAVERIKENMLKANAETEWVPGHLRDGRFGRWLEGARDWAISRNRYWGTPLPIWRCTETGEIEVIGSREDLMNKKPLRFTRLTAVRHGESEGNLIPVYQGQLPGTDLTTRGRAQAAATGDMLSNERIARIYCSPLARTRQTAEEIAKKTGAEVVVDERLREVEFGEYEGKSIDFSDLTFVKARRAHKLEQNQIESIYHFPGMETWSQVQARIASCLTEILGRHRGEHVVVVTHADPVIGIKHFFTKEDPRKLVEQPYPRFAEPHEFYWDHDRQGAMDLHKESVDDVYWPASAHESSVEVSFVRHGETGENKKGICQGCEVDGDLNETGQRQAMEAAKKLKGQHFDVIISSPLARTRQTAEAIATELGIPVSEHWPELRERSLGEWAGRDLKGIMKEHPAVFPDETKVALHHKTPKDGESLSQFLNRGELCCRMLQQRFPGKKVLVITHGGLIRSMRIYLENLSYAASATLKAENANAYVFTIHPVYRRIPDVLDCWFESGSMPYAQNHFPFDSKQKNQDRRTKVKKDFDLPPGFPADFIAEGIDQTRGWFYTLTVLSSALYNKPAFMNCIVNGTVLAEDGKKMSKRLKNYPEPLVVVEKHGADAVRFALMSSPAVRGEDLRFSEKLVEEQLRNVLLPLWNTYSFFVTYANAAAWAPSASRRTSNHPLDVWIRAEVQDLVNRMTEQLDRYDLSATCAELHDTIDALTNWYVRLSRRRFAGKAGLHAGEEALEEMNEQGRLDALSTLYDVLLTLSQLMAPFCPFVADAMYLNLVTEEHGSVHFTDWPETKKLTAKDRKLLQKTRLLRLIVSLGLKARSEKKIRVRQPLAKATVAVPTDLMGDTITPAEMHLLQEEINVKLIEFVDDPGSLAERIAMVDARKVGPRLGARVQELIQAGKRGDFTVQDDGSVLILDERLSGDEVSIVYRGKEGEDVAADKGVVVALDTRVTKELEGEGLARELIRAVQRLRKEEGYAMGEQVVIAIDGADTILQDHGETVQKAACVTFGAVQGTQHQVDISETLSVTITFPARA